MSKLTTDHPDLAVFGVDDEPEPRTLVDILEATVNAYPTATALVGTDGELTYDELSARIAWEVDRLADAGIGRGDRIGIRVPSGTTDLYVAILATLVTGAAYVPVDVDDPDSRAAVVWEEAGVAAVYGPDLHLDLRESRYRTPARPTVDDDAWIIFTSGSTGKPKGVAVPHRCAAALVDAEARMFLTDAPLRPGDRVMAGLSVAFDASCEEMWLAWRNGAALVAAPRDVVRSGDVLGGWITGQGITAVSTVPTLASFWDTESLSAVRLLIFGGEALPPELVNRLAAPGRELWNTYGPTEATVISTGQLMEPLGDDDPVRIGRATPGWRLAVVDPATGEPVPWGESGELIVGGVGLARYLDPVKDAEVYAPLPSLGWQRAYRTGDLVLAEREGLVFAGRADDQIKFGGRRMELGEIDRALTGAPGVGAAAAAKKVTPAGSDVIVGYLVAADPAVPVDLAAVRAHLTEVLPGGIAPLLYVIDELPMKTSGKTDRKALPWPLPSAGGDSGDVPEDLRHLADLWTDQLGPVPLARDANFFDLGGSSVAVAKLAAALRADHPAVDIGALYDHPTLETMAGYLATLRRDTGSRPMPRPIPRWAGVFQFLVVCAIYVVNAARYVVGSILVVWALGFFFDAGWVPFPPLWPLTLGWILLFSTPGKVLQIAVVTRLCTLGIVPGEYLRGGWTHLRIWAAERYLAYLKLESVLGTPFTPWLYRLFGCRVGRSVDLHSFPPVTGLLTVGDGTSVEHEVDLNGHWIDGDTLHVGGIVVAADVRVGTRTIVGPGSRIGDHAEILPGSAVAGDVPARTLCTGSPLRIVGEAGLSWPEQTPVEAVADGRVRMLSPFALSALYSLGHVWMAAMLIIAVLPGTLLVLPHVVYHERYEEVFPILALWTPLFAVLTVVTWLTLVILSVRFCAVFILPGYFPGESSAGVALWLTHVLLQKTLTSAYYMYAGWLTPAFFRLLGARVGEETEISTAETIPHLTWIGDRCFLADHAMCTSTRLRAGWVHIGTTVIGNNSFVGNSGIIGADRDLPADSLVGVLSSTPTRPDRGSSWLGRTTRQIPRLTVEADTSRTFNPPRRLKVARGVVEGFRLLPVIIAAYLDLFIVWAGTRVYMYAFLRGDAGWSGLWLVFLWAWPIVMAAGIIASLIPVAAKWILIGRFTPGERSLHTTFVWRSELVDNFAELLAVPSLVRMSLGSPVYGWWARLMGTRIGRDVWCETWWLPEFDLISIGDRATVNRGTVLQTHLFHDRVMSLEPVTMHPGATLGANSFLLPGSSLGERSTIMSGSLVLRGDMIPADSVWAGNPVAHVDTAPAPGVHIPDVHNGADMEVS